MWLFLHASETIPRTSPVYSCDTFLITQQLKNLVLEILCMLACLRMCFLAGRGVHVANRTSRMWWKRTSPMLLPCPGTRIGGVSPPVKPYSTIWATALHVAAPPVQSPAPLWHFPPPATEALVSSRRPPGSLLFAPAASPAPRRLASYLHHKALCLAAVDPHAYPRIPEPSSADPREKRTLYGTYGAPSATGELRLRQAVAEFRASEAAKCGCGVSDIAWYCHASHVPVSGTNAWGQSSTKSNECLSYSTTLSSGPCMASFVFLYLNSCIENSLVLQALQVSEGVAPGTVHFSFSCLCVACSSPVLPAMSELTLRETQKVVLCIQYFSIQAPLVLTCRATLHACKVSVLCR